MNAIELFFNILDYEVLINSAANKKISINGFKTLRKVPENILRKNIALRFINKPTAFKGLLEDICYLNINDVKTDSVDDIIYNFMSYPLKIEAPNYIALGILILNYPEYAESKVDIFCDNVEKNRHIFDGCMQKQEITKENCYDVMNKVLQLYDPIQWFEVYSSNIEYMIEMVQNLEMYNYLRKMFKGMSFYDVCTSFDGLTKKYPDYMISLSYIKENIDTINNLSDDERYFFNKMLFNAYQCINIEHFRIMQTRVEEGLKKKNHYKSKLKDLEKKNSLIMSSYYKLEEEFTEYKNNLQGLKEARNLSEMNTIDNTFQGEFDYIIITKYDRDKIFQCIENCYILSPDDIALLNNLLIDFKGSVFIDRTSINSTKELFCLEEIIKDRGVKKHIIFAKSFKDFIKNIIIKQYMLGGAK